MTDTRAIVIANPNDGPALPVVVQSHLGQLLAAAYAQLDISPDLPKRLDMLLAQLQQVTIRSEDRRPDAFHDGLLAAAPSLRRYAMSLTRDYTAAEDLVQDTLLRAWRSQGRFEAGTNLDAWLFTILRNQFYTGARKSWREVSGTDGALGARLTSAPEQMGHLDLKDVQAALSRLSAEMREALLLVTIEGMDHEQAAAAMGCQVGTIKSRVSRARQKLAALLGYDGSEVGADGVTLSAMEAPAE